MAPKIRDSRTEILYGPRAGDAPCSMNSGQEHGCISFRIHAGISYHRNFLHSESGTFPTSLSQFRDAFSTTRASPSHFPPSLLAPPPMHQDGTLFGFLQANPGQGSPSRDPERCSLGAWGAGPVLTMQEDQGCDALC